MSAKTGVLGHENESSTEEITFKNGNPNYGSISPTISNPETSGELDVTSCVQSRTTRSPSKEGEKMVSWRDLPHKGQLAILAIARLSEPLTQTSLQSYIFHQLRSFDPSLPVSAISYQVGILQGCFTGAQFFTGLLWGRVADSDWAGRKIVILTGILGTCVSCVGFGFAETFQQAIAYRVLGGALNGNVGIMSTMISEVIKEKKFQSRAFLLLPMCFNIGVIVGPVLGGVLADPVNNYPSVFGKHSYLGGSDGVLWMRKWPYALPNIVSAVFLFGSATLVVLGLRETLVSLQDKPDKGLEIRRATMGYFRQLFACRNHQYRTPQYSAPDNPPTCHGNVSRRGAYEEENDATARTTRHKSKLSFRRIWKKNVVVTISAHAALAFHYGTFNNLWVMLLSSDRYIPGHASGMHKQQLPLFFTGGLGMAPRSVGLALAVLGTIGITLQLILYPWLSTRFGVINTYRYSLALFPLAYSAAPYLALIPSTKAPPHEASGIGVWIGVLSVLTIQVMARTFSFPATMILVNNCSPHPTVLGTIHGLAQSVASAARTVGPILGGWAFGYGLDIGLVGLGWWGLSFAAVCGLLIGCMVTEADQEIWPDDEAES